jgi:hypothetical protein
MDAAEGDMHVGSFRFSYAHDFARRSMPVNGLAFPTTGQASRHPVGS